MGASTGRNSPQVTALCVVTGVAVVAVASALAISSTQPAWAVVIVFALLVILAENLGVPLVAGSNISAGFMLLIAAALVFREQSSPLGALLVGMCGGIYYMDIRERDWRRFVFNVANFGFATLAAYGAFLLFPQAALDDVGLLVLASVGAAVAFFLVNDSLVATVVSLAHRRPAREVIRELLSSSLQSYPFALLGVFLGRLYLDLGLVVVPLFVTPILIARQTFASYLALKRSHDDTVRILIGALETKDPYTAGHAERVATFAQYIGLELGFSAKRLERLRFAALMHDVGKLVVPNHLLNKPGRLTKEEFARVQQHEQVSVEILSRIDFLAPVAPSALSEHTRFRPVADTKGQPIEPHIVAVADAFDAMTSTRSYRKALSQATAFLELRENAGKQFHPRVVIALITAIERRDEHYGEGYEPAGHNYATEPPVAGLGSAGLGDLLADEEPDPADAAKP